MNNNSDFVKLLMIDNQPAGDTFIDYPSWKDIEEALYLMDGHYRTYLGLYKQEEPGQDFLMVGGGRDGIYVCSYYNKNMEYYVLNETVADPETVIDVPIGQMNAKQKIYCNALADIVESVQYFFQTGTMNPLVKWIQV